MSRCSTAMTCLGSACAAAFITLMSATALAGGFTFPDNGTEAIGRGGAFTAKADSPLALEYNVAGLAGLRGTHLLFDNNITLSTYGLTPPGGSPILDQSAPFYAPWFGLSSDFGYFDHVTFAIGIFGPPSVGKRSYDPTTVARYDVTSTDLLVFFPTLAVAFRPHRIIDIGVSLADTVGRYQLATVASSSIGDVPSNLNVSSNFDPVLSLGILLHPLRSLDIGLHVRSAPNLGISDVSAKGNLTTTVAGVMLTPEPTSFTADQPWILRGGVRYAMHKDRREIFDVELDGVLEFWNAAQGTGLSLSTTSPLNMMPLTLLAPHHYGDTYSVRLGGAFNQPIGAALLTVRLGTYYESSASPDEYLRLDFDTLAKAAGTIGLGLRARGVTLNLAYAYVQSLSRTVTNGQLMPINALTGGTTSMVINDGTFAGHNQVFSVGLHMVFEELARGDRWTRRDL